MAAGAGSYFDSNLQKWVGGDEVSLGGFDESESDESQVDSGRDNKPPINLEIPEAIEEIIEEGDYSFGEDEDPSQGTIEISSDTIVNRKLEDVAPTSTLIYGSGSDSPYPNVSFNVSTETISSTVLEELAIPQLQIVFPATHLTPSDRRDAQLQAEDVPQEPTQGLPQIYFGSFTHFVTRGKTCGRAR
jgi:hypothetical protein